MNKKQKDDQYSEPETERRAATALRAAFGMPPKPQSEMKLGKPKGKPSRSPGKRKAVRNSGF